MRSPPQSSPNACVLPETRSEPDLSPASSVLESNQFDSVNITTRPNNKRFRGEEDDSITEPDAIEELKSMLISWKADQDKILNKLVADVSELRQQNLSIQNSNLEIEKSIKFFNTEYEAMKTRLDAVEAEHKEYVMRFNEIANNNSEQKIAVLEAKIDSMEQQARQYNIEVCNLPEKRNENLLTIMESICTAINSPVAHTDIISIHRVPHARQQDTKPKNLIVKFRSRIIRDNILSAYRNVKSIKSDQIGISGASVSVYLNEHLTLKNKALFREAKILAGKSGFKYVWVRNATILVREKDNDKSFAIRSVEDLNKIVASKKTGTNSASL